MTYAFTSSIPQASFSTLPIFFPLGKNGKSLSRSNNLSTYISYIILSYVFIYLYIIYNISTSRMYPLSLFSS